MGRGAQMRVQNEMGEGVTTYVSDLHCMYDGGREGSNLSVFDNAVIQPGGAYPPAGPQYIETEASGACATLPSSFTLEIKYYTPDGPSRGVEGGWIPADELFTITESGGQYACSSASKLVAVKIDNGGDQSTIDIVVSDHD